jgi:hypothetical protein
MGVRKSPVVVSYPSILMLGERWGCGGKYYFGASQGDAAGAGGACRGLGGRD